MLHGKQETEGILYLMRLLRMSKYINFTINVLGKTHILITTHAVTSFVRRTLWSSLNLTETENNKVAANYNSVPTEQLGSTD